MLLYVFVDIKYVENFCNLVDLFVIVECIIFGILRIGLIYLQLYMLCKDIVIGVLEVIEIGLDCVF